MHVQMDTMCLVFARALIVFAAFLQVSFYVFFFYQRKQLPKLKNLQHAGKSFESAIKYILYNVKVYWVIWACGYFFTGTIAFSLSKTDTKKIFVILITYINSIFHTIPRVLIKHTVI